jgi:hypothetical protein
MIPWGFAMVLFLAALLVHAEIVTRDANAPKPKDPYRLDRFRRGEDTEPGSEPAP